MRRRPDNRGKLPLVLAVVVMGLLDGWPNPSTPVAARRASGRKQPEEIAIKAQEPSPPTRNPVRPSLAEIDGLPASKIIERVMTESRQREARMRQYSVPSTYRVTGSDGKVRAEVEAVLHYRSPGWKEFRIVSQSGSETIRNRVFKPLMEVEIETAAGRNRHDGSITPANYDFILLGEDNIAGSRCYLLEAHPKRNDKYLFRGRVWIHATDFSIVRITGEPARNPSFWISRVEFVRNYQKIGEFWLPARNESRTQVKLFGRNTLTIDYGQYQIS